jgi:acetyltransferase-like isoleucine patch superfamily enzyme
MLINITEKDYYNYFSKDSHPFLSQKFVNLNKEKTDQILFLVEDNPNPSLGIVLGLRNGYLWSPFSAPFGGFHFKNELLSTNTICSFLTELKKYIVENKLKGIKLTLPPDIYSPTINAKFINCLNNESFKIYTIDLTGWVDLESFVNKFKNQKARQYLNQSINLGLKFKPVNDINEKIAAYNIIKENRENLNRPIYMTFNDLEDVNKVWQVDYFIVENRENEKLASAIIYQAHPYIAYAVFWGDNEKGRSLRAMNFLIFNIWKFYKENGFKYLDIGISTEKGIPNEGLIWFKESHDAITSLRYTFNWENDISKLIQVKKQIMEPINRYGITLRLVEEKDAEFIFELRNNSGLNRFISYTSPKLNDQIKWIKDYKIREEAGLEYYFVAQDQLGNNYGTIRLYNLDEKSFEIGSWLFNNNSPIGMAVKAHFIGFETGFEILKAEYCRFEIRKKNQGVLRYMRDFETTLVNEDDLNYYFTLSKESFYKRRSQLSFFNSYHSKPEIKTYIHPTAEVQSTQIGEGTSIWQFCVVLKDSVIGKNCNLNYNVFVENDEIIGDNVTIKSGVQLWDGLRIEDNVFISPNVAFTNDFAPRSKQYPNKFLSTLVKEGASIGANSTVIGGITIGKYAMVGAGSLLTKDVPDYNLWYGHPASFKAYICKCGQKLNNLLICTSCNRQYKSTDGIISEL